MQNLQILQAWKQQQSPLVIRGHNNKVLKQFNLKNETTNIDNDTTYYVVARLHKIKKVFQQDSGISYEAVTRFGQIIQLVIWKESKYMVDEKQTYEIHNLKKKVYRDQIGLQSISSKTKFNVSQYKILNKKQLTGNNSEDHVQRKKYNQKRLGAGQIVYSVAEMKQMGEERSQKAFYAYTEGLLQLNLSKGCSDNISQFRRKIFYFKCLVCEDKVSKKSFKPQPKITQTKDIVCDNCLKTLEVMWNIKCLFIDHDSTLPCRINNQIAEKLIKMTPRDGMILFSQDYQKFESVMKKTISFRKGVYKFSCKRDAKREGEIYFNLCEFLSDGSKVSFERAMKQLRQTLIINHKYRLFPKLNHQPYQIIDPRPIPYDILRQHEKMERISFYNQPDDEDFSFK